MLFPTTTLNLVGLSTAGGDYIGLDNVDVEVGSGGGGTVPEPGTCGLVLTGIGVLGTMARRYARG